MILTLPYPVSANRYWRIMNNRVVRSAEAVKYKKAVQLSALPMRHVKPLTEAISIAIVLHPKATKTGDASKTRIDLDNALKVTLDALQGIAYIDDKQVEHINASIGSPLIDGGLTVAVSDYNTHITDTQRMDWLADVNNTIGSVMLPNQCVTENIEQGLRGAIDAAILIWGRK